MSGINGADGNQTSAADPAVSAKSILKNFLVYLFKPTAFGLTMSFIFLPALYLLSYSISDDLLFYYISMNIRFDFDSLEIKRYVIFGFSIFLTYIILNVLYRKLIINGNPINILRLWMISFAVFIVISFIGSIIISKHNWDYYFTRPEVFNELRDVKRAASIIPVHTIKDGSGFRFFFNMDYSVQDQLRRAKKRPNRALSARNLLLFNEAGLALPEASRLPQNGLDYYKLVKDTGILKPPDPGHKNLALLNGLIIDAIDSNGHDLILITVSGGDAYNDLYPYSELLFEKKPGIERPVLVRSQLFFTDRYGFEDAEWYSVCIFYAVLSGYLAFLLTIMTAVVRGIISWHAPRFRPPASAP